MAKVTDPDIAACAQIAYRIYSHNRSKPEVLRKSGYLSAFAESCPIRIFDGDLILGPSFPLEGAWSRWKRILGDDRHQEMDFHGNIGHIIVDYGRVIQLGVDGLLALVDTAPSETQSHSTNCAAFREALQAFSTYIMRHAREAEIRADTSDVSLRSEMLAVAANCRHIATRAPGTFWQALQLVWFVHVFLHAESMAQAVSFGRFDQYLGPYLEHDLLDGSITMERAGELLACFWFKCNTIGDPSQNLIVGGVDSEGQIAENALSYLCLDIARQLRLPQPSMSVRIGPATTDKFWHSAIALCAEGFGMPSFFNDPVVIRSLENIGIPTERARDWGIVGCYEANPQGDTLGLTVAGAFSLPEVLLEFLGSMPAGDSFDGFLAGFKKHLSAFYSKELVRYQETFDRFKADAVSPFESLCLGNCIERGLAAEEGGARFSLFGVNIMGLGTLVDSLLTIKALVFDCQDISIDYLKEQLDADFEDEALWIRCRNLDGKYGTGSSFSDSLAQDLLIETAGLVHSHPLTDGVRPYPAFFWFLADVYRLPGATPDGRRSGDRVSYGVGPTELGKGKSATSILLSAAHLAHDLCPCGNPLILSLSPDEVKGADGISRVKDLVKTYFDEGGFHLHFNIVDAGQLRNARDKPFEHDELTVRISGFSARFAGLDPTLQNAIIERSEKGM